MEKELTVFLNLKAPCEANIFAFLTDLQSFLGSRDLGSIVFDFTTMSSSFYRKDFWDK